MIYSTALKTTRMNDVVTTIDAGTVLTVGLSGSNIILDSLSITAGQTVTLNSSVITHG